MDALTLLSVMVTWKEPKVEPYYQNLTKITWSECHKIDTIRLLEPNPKYCVTIKWIGEGGKREIATICPDSPQPPEIEVTW